LELGVVFLLLPPFLLFILTWRSSRGCSLLSKHFLPEFKE
jgi:hypothetical protein